MYDEKRDSDSMMLLRVYNEWLSKFHPYLKHKNGEDEQRKAEERRNTRDGRRIFIKRPMASERKFCFDRNLDINMLREVAMLAEEVRYRFMRMNISTQCLNSK